jgi:hypothetical protein
MKPATAQAKAQVTHWPSMLTEQRRKTYTAKSYAFKGSVKIGILHKNMQIIINSNLSLARGLKGIKADQSYCILS